MVPGQLEPFDLEKTSVLRFGQVFWVETTKDLCVLRLWFYAKDLHESGNAYFFPVKTFLAWVPPYKSYYY